MIVFVWLIAGFVDESALAVYYAKYSETNPVVLGYQQARGPTIENNWGTGRGFHLL
ncbi:MAG: hypothetical protein ABJH01_16915 [Algoriphagus sp.]|uniref:hypothetical protein n=1 Tax=Algoriphagus sp. TaxID=1872435 RepID=UPI0032985993